MPKIYLVKEIFYINRKTNQKEKEIIPGSKTMFFLYAKPLGKLNLFLLFKRKFLSKFSGWLANTEWSGKKIDKFIGEHSMDMSQFVEPKEGFKTFNRFFYRHIKDGARPIGENIVSPADGKVLAFNNIKETQEFFVKGSAFNVSTFLKDDELAKKYENGSLMVVRLAPADYHRYHFPLSGIPTATKKIKGFYYSVSPLALQKNMRIFCENKREYTVLKNDIYGDVLICDVGATLTGSIIQTYQPNKPLNKGDEKGYFAFGGSTLILLFEPNKMTFSKDLVENTKNGFETTVLMGQTIGV